jgi:hypothetical protein
VCEALCECDGDLMAAPRFLPHWLGGECDRVDGHGVPLQANADALPERPESVDDPLPEDLERLLRDPELSVGHDRAFHETMRAYCRRDPDARVTRELYLNLWALLDRETDG